MKESRFDFDPSFAWEWSNFTDGITENSEQLIRSFVYAGIATVLCILIGYPWPTSSRSGAAATRTCCSGWWWCRSSRRS